jgi:hypothetical protein
MTAIRAVPSSPPRAPLFTLVQWLEQRAGAFRGGIALRSRGDAAAMAEHFSRLMAPP